jgi:tRNA pseudouridine55 synthase
MSALRRTRAAGYALDDAVTLDRVLDSPDPGALVRPVDSCFAPCPAVTIGGKALLRAKNGNPFPWDAPEGLYRVYGPDGGFLLLGECRGGTMYTKKSFFEVT